MSNRFAEFVSTIKHRGLAKQYYSVEFHYPAIYKAPELQIIPFYVAAVNAPGIELITQTVKDTGLNRRVVVDKDYGNVTTTFYCDSTMVVKAFFDKWLHDTIATNGGKFQYPSEYIVSSMGISHVTAAKNEVYTITLTNAYPIAVSEVSMSHDSNAPLSFSVVWTFDSWSGNVIAQPDVKIPQPGLESVINKVLNEANKFRALATDPTKVNAILGLLR